MKAVLFPGQSVPPTLVDVAAQKLEVLQGIVGGYIEWIVVEKVGEEKTHAYCNEEGKLDGLPMNLPATAFLHSLGLYRDDIICGALIVLGDGPDGEEGDVPDWVLRYAQQVV